MRREGNRMKIYISGAITGTLDYMERFSIAEERLKSQGYTVINPAKVNAQLPEDTTWKQYMDISILMLGMCDGIYMLNGWELSKGAKMEFAYAKRHLDLIIFERE
jgi:hypothetical protein